MGTYSLGTDIVDSIKDTLSAAPSLARSQSYDELTEGIPDRPMLQVYPEENPGTSGHSQTNKLTLTGKHSIKEYLIHADYVAKQRADIAEDMARVVDGIDDMEDILDTQGCPPFGCDYIISFRWNWKRVVYDYANVKYVGARFYIRVEVGSGG